METKPNARIISHRVPPAAPGKCVVCGYSGGKDEDDRTFIDFGFDLDYYGVVYFCSSCMVEIANVIGFFSEDQYNKIARENLLLSDSLGTVRRERDAATDALRTYLNGGPAIGAVAESEELPKPVPPSKRPAPKKSGPKSEVSSNVTKQGPNDNGNDDGSIISLG